MSMIKTPLLVLIILGALLLGGPILAAPNGLNFQGRLVKDGSAVESNVTLTLKVTSIAVPGVTPECTLYEENHFLNLAGSDGIFSIKIGGGTRTANDESLSLEQVFTNNETAITGLACAGAPTATSYTPQATDSRNIYVSFVDGTETVAFSAPYVIQSVPYAIEAQRLAGKQASEFLQTTINTTQTKLNDIMAPAAYDELLDLINGTSSNFGNFTPTTSVNFNGQNMTNATGISLSGSANRTIAVARQTVSNTAGNNLTVSASGATNGASDKSGGNLILSSGTSTGTGSSAIEFQTSTPQGSTNTTDNTPTTKMTILGNGNVGIGTSTPRQTLHVVGNYEVGAATSDAKAYRFRTTGGALDFEGSGADIYISVFNGMNFTGPQRGYLGFSHSRSSVVAAGKWTFKAGPGTGITTLGSGTPILYIDGTETTNVGVGTTAPAAKLSVAGDVQIGDSGATCSATTKGSIRYNDVTSVLEFCNGTTWTVIQGATCNDATPDMVTFANQANQATSTLVMSNIVQVTGVNCSVTTTISGPGSPAYRICSDSACSTVLQDWTTGPSSMMANQYVQVRQTTSVSGGVTNNATLMVGAGAGVWSVSTTGDCLNSPAPGTICADGAMYVGLSADGNVPMYTTRCDLGQTWNGSSCSGSRWIMPWNNGTEPTIATGFSNKSSGSSNTSGLTALHNAESPYNAAMNCANLSENGHADWYLPSESEMTVLYDNQTAIGNFTVHAYWTSSEHSLEHARAKRFGEGVAYGVDKVISLTVRCVRK